LNLFRQGEYIPNGLDRKRSEALASKRTAGIDRDPLKYPPRSHKTRRPSSSSENPTPRSFFSDLSEGSTASGLFGEDELDRAQDPPLQCQHRSLHARLVGAVPVQYPFTARFSFPPY
jgi:hypothetical protein